MYLFNRLYIFILGLGTLTRYYSINALINLSHVNTVFIIFIIIILKVCFWIHIAYSQIMGHRTGGILINLQITHSN